MVFGKIVAGMIGLLTGGWPGLLIGLLVGHLFDRGLARTLGFASPANLQRIRDSFFETTFLLSGHLAKADGRVSEAEIAHTEQVFVQMGLDAAGRRRAIECFRAGSAPGFDLERAVRAFVANCGPQRALQRTLLLFLVSLAHADQSLQPPEHAVLVRVATLLGLAPGELDALLDMARAQGHFHGGSGGGAAGHSTAGAVERAYTALGVEPAVSDRDLKRAYRRLMSENHPDKLIARGVPEEMVRLATERSQEIQAAYETVRKHRGGR